MVQNGRIENLVRSLGPRGLNQNTVGNDRRHIFRTYNGMSHEITYTGPLNKNKLRKKWFNAIRIKFFILAIVFLYEARKN